jgi:hypothetical protein
MAMKLLSRDAKRRPRDQQDLVELVRVADENDWRIASSAVDLIERRGFARGRPLSLELRALREG